MPHSLQEGDVNGYGLLGCQDMVTRDDSADGVSQGPNGCGAGVLSTRSAREFSAFDGVSSVSICWIW
jgi:hypothetical protein